MFKFLAASLLVWSAEALLFPNNNGMGEPEPELLFVCPAPNAPQFGSIKCDYSIFDLECTAQCDSGFSFENGAATANLKCDLFKGQMTADIPKCVRIGGSVTVPVVPVVTARPSTAVGCVRSINDCFNKVPGDYSYCDNCRMFATCSASGFYVRQCPGLTVFSEPMDRCMDLTIASASCKFIQI